MISKLALNIHTPTHDAYYVRLPLEPPTTVQIFSTRNDFRETEVNQLFGPSSACRSRIMAINRRLAFTKKIVTNDAYRNRKGICEYILRTMPTIMHTLFVDPLLLM